MESIKDFHELHFILFKTFILENKLPEFFEKRLVQSAIKEYLEQNPDNAPPGLQATSEYTVRITKSRENKENV